MGFFSWKAAGTGESISNTYSTRGARPVHLLQPNGAAPITEPAYEGYGTFGGVMAYVWVAQNNLPAEMLAKYPEDGGPISQYGIGYTLTAGYSIHLPTGRKFTIMTPEAPIIDPEITDLQDGYGTPVDWMGGMTPNEAMAAGHIGHGMFEFAHPLKFSHDPNAVYEDLPASENCPEQGFLYDDDEDQDEDEDEDDEDDTRD